MMKLKLIRCTRCCSHTRDEASGVVVASTQSPKIFVTGSLVAMTNSLQGDDTLNGCRTVLSIVITGNVVFMVGDTAFNHGHQMVPSTLVVRHA